MFMAVPFILGALTVVQSVMNRSLGVKYGWPVAGMINNTFGFLFAGLLVLILAVIFSGKGISRVDEWHWWYFIPGCFGMLFVMGIPLAVHQIGASRTFVLLVASQILFGLLWDLWSTPAVDGQWPVSPIRILGVGLTLLGAVVVSVF